MGTPPVFAESHISSAVAFVEGGVQDSCEDSCSICLEDFCDSNPVTVTSCKHQYHLQCILEWSQRSNECPMCWQPLSLKDPSSQDLLDAVELARPYLPARQIPSGMHRNSMDEFEFHQVPAYTDVSDFEERIMQHLAASARAHHFARRESLRNRPSSVQDHPQIMVVPTHPSSTAVPLVGGHAAVSGNFTPLSAVGPPRFRPQDQLVQQGGQMDVTTPHTARSFSDPVRPSEISRTGAQSTSQQRHNTELEAEEENQQRTGSSDFSSFSESLKSRLAAASSRYKETFTKTTRGFRDKFRARNNAMTDLGARAREVSAGVVRALERISLESKGRGESDLPTTSSGLDSGGVDELATLTAIEGSNRPEVTMGLGRTSNSLGPSLQGTSSN